MPEPSTFPSDRRRRRPRRRSVSPSPSVLSFLAALAASSPGVSASPLSFLCPSIDLETPTHPRKRKLQPRSSIAQHLPQKYEPNEEGVWRQVETYSLYGSTVCKTCHHSSPVHADIGVSDVPQADKSTDIRDTLPKGWHIQQRSPPTDLIIALSLVLALVICFLIIGCLFWRNYLRKKFRNDDIEMKPKRRRRRSRGTDEAEVPPASVRPKRESWSRATVRWRVNARYNSRQRRRRTTTISRTSTIAVTSSTALSCVPGPVMPSDPSPIPSRRSSVSEPPAQPTPQTPDTREAVLSSSSPPAYHRRSSMHALPASSAQERSSQDLPRSSGHSWSASPDAYSPSQHTAHVATDDKALLAQLAQSASVPPPLRLSESSQSRSGGPAAITFSSAPAWEDEALDGFNLDDSSPEQLSHPPSPLSPLFPPPLSKGEIDDFYEYPHTFGEDIPNFEAHLEPSAPPFEEHAPLASPSAPPIFEEHEHQHEVEAPALPEPSPLA